MPTITVDDGCPLNVEVSGRDDAPALMLSNSLGTDLHMWDDQAAEFARHFRLIRYDRRGHGKSGAPKGPYSFDRFGRDILGVLDGLGVKKTNWCGLSMGGMDGQWLGANAPDRIGKLVLANTTPTRRHGPTACASSRRTNWATLSPPTWSAGSPRASASVRRRQSSA